MNWQMSWCVRKIFRSLASIKQIGGKNNHFENQTLPPAPPPIWPTFCRLHNSTRPTPPPWQATTCATQTISQMLALRLQRCVTSCLLRCGPVSSCPPEHSACQPFSVVTPLCLSCLQSSISVISNAPFRVTKQMKSSHCARDPGFCQSWLIKWKTKSAKFSTYSEYFVYTDGGVYLLELCLRLVSHRFHKWALSRSRRRPGDLGRELTGKQWVTGGKRGKRGMRGKRGGCNSWHRTAWWGNTAAVSAQSRVIRTPQTLWAILSPC